MSEYDEAIDDARRHVDANGPVLVDDVLDHVAASGYTIDRDDLIDELVDGQGIWWVADALLRDVHVLPGRVLTHRLTADEIQGGYLTVEPDLHFLSLDESPVFETSLGAMETAFDSGEVRLVGRFDAFAAGDVVAVRWTSHGALDVRPAGPESDGSIEVDALAAAFEQQRRPNGTAMLLDVLVAACQLQPKAFEQPPSPLCDLLPRAGLSRRGDEVADASFDWEALRDERHHDYVEQLAEQYDLELDEAEHLATLALASLADDLAGASFDAGPSIDALRDPVATAAYLEPKASRMLDDVERLRAFATAVMTAAGGHPPPGAHLLLARAAELEGDAIVHARETEQALRIDPEFWPAFEERAWVRADRGDARGAAADLEQVAESDDPPLLVLDRFTAPGPMTAGRNDRCPCGSGQKHKLCCGRTNGYRLVDRAPWLYEKAMWFASRPAQRKDLSRLIEEILDDVDPFAIPMDFFVEDPVVRDVALFSTGLISRFRDERRVLLPPDEAELLDEWVGARSGLWRVDRMIARDTIAVVDLVSGEEVVVGLHASDESLAPGRTIAATLLPDGERLSILGWVALRDEVVEKIRESYTSGDDLAAMRVAVRSRWDAAIETLELMGTEFDDRLTWLFPSASPDELAEWSLQELVQNEHPELVDAIASGRKTIRIEGGNEINPVQHLAMHEIAANQILGHEPPEMWLTAVRLTAQGYDAHEVQHMLASTVSNQVHTVLHDSQPYDAERQIAELEALPETWEAARLAHRPDHPRGRHPRRRS